MNEQPGDLSETVVSAQVHGLQQLLEVFFIFAGRRFQGSLIFIDPVRHCMDKTSGT